MIGRLLKNYHLVHPELPVVQLVLDDVVVVVQRLVEQVVGKVEEGEGGKVGQDVGDLCPVGEKVVGQVQLGYVGTSESKRRSFDSMSSTVNTSTNTIYECKN